MLSLSLSFLLVCRILSAAGVIEMPESAEVALCEKAEFRCWATRVDTLDWWVDGSVASHTNITERGITYHTVSQNGAIRSILYINGTIRNNGTTVQCETFTRPDTLWKSPPVTLTVQATTDELEPPADFKIEYRDRKVIRLGWRLPLTCAGVHIHSINVYHSKQNDSSDMSLITLLGNSTSYNFSSNPDPCLQYFFRVSATYANNIGESNTSEVVSGNFVSDPAPVDTAAVAVAVEFTQENMITVAFTFPAALCPGKNTYMVNMTCSSTEFRELRPQVSTQQNKTVVEFQASPDVLPLNNLYHTIITSTNALGSTENSGTIHTSTYDVQNATISVQEPSGRFCLHCTFANGSTARGCMAIIKNTDFSHASLRQLDSNNLTAKSCSNFSVSGAGSYEVLVYDLEEDGTRSNNPALTLSLQLSGEDYDSSDSETVEEDEEFIESSKGIITVMVTIGGFVLCLIILILVAAVIVFRRRQKQRKGNGERIYDTIPEDYTKHQDDMQTKLADNVAYGHTKV